MKRVWLLGFLVVLVFSASSDLPAAPVKKPRTLQHFTMKDGLSSEMINAIAVQGDSVWFGTYAGGATLYDREKKLWKAYTTKGEPQSKVDDGNSMKWKNLLPYNHVSAIVPDEDRVWFGTYFYGFGGGGISYYNPKRTPPWKAFNTYTSSDLAKKVVSIAADGQSLWVGSEKGLCLLDKKTEQWKTFYSPQKGISGNFVNALLAEGESLWAGTNGGVSRFDKTRKTFKNYSTKQGLPESEIKAIARVGQKLWAGAADGGLFELDPGSDRWKKLEPTDPIRSSSLYCITAVKGKAFICRDNGLSIYDLAENRWESISQSDGLLSSTVLCAAEDKNGVWLGTDKGASLLSINP
jgi:ligand-binding sensor domain-containing protein